MKNPRLVLRQQDTLNPLHMPKQEGSSGIVEFFVHDYIRYQDLNLLHIQLLTVAFCLGRIQIRNTFLFEYHGFLVHHYQYILLHRGSEL